MFRGSRSRLLTYYLLVMIAILGFFTLAFYILFTHNLYNQLEANLKTLAQVASYSFVQVSTEPKNSLELIGQTPWQDIFIPEQQGLEWFSQDGRLLASQGVLQLGFSPQPGFWTLHGQQSLGLGEIKVFTLPVLVDRSQFNLPPLAGFIRSSQKIAPFENLQKQFLGQLGLTNLVTLMVVTLGGIWLTKKALEPIQESIQEIKQLTGDISHELRTPLTAIKTSVEVMRNHPERFEGKDYKKLEAIAQATEQITSLTEDLLFLARTQQLSTNACAAAWQPIALHHLLPSLCNWLEPLAEKQEVSLECQCLASANIMGDAAQLTRLGRNLLENALYYTPAGGKVTVRLISANHLAVITVEDTGIGIAPQHLSSVFNRFWRGEQARSFRAAGTGLGLSIAQAIAHHHGGTITVSSQLGLGTCFHVSLPLQISSQKNNSAAYMFPFWSSLGFSNKIQFFQKLAWIVVIIILIILPVFLLNKAINQAHIFGGVKFNNGAYSFADEVVLYQRNSLKNTHSYVNSKTTAILGIPPSPRLDIFALWTKDNNYTALGKGDSITLRFTDNLLTGNDSKQPDLYIFLRDNISTKILVEISKDNYEWQSVGYVDQDQHTIDIDGMGWGKNDLFSYIRLSNISDSEQKEAVIIDAVGAISSMLLLPSDSRTIPSATIVLWLIVSGLIFWVILKVSQIKKLN